LETDEIIRKVSDTKGREGTMTTRIINLTQGFITLVDEADYLIVSKYKWFAVVTVTGPNGYHVAACRWTKGESPRRLIYMSYAVLGLKYLNNDKVIDHINRNALDNRKINLRITNKSVNAFNSDRSINASFIWYDRCKDRFKAYVPNTTRKSKEYIGSFKTFKEAKLAQEIYCNQKEINGVRERVFLQRKPRADQLAP
jgi:hypothetical protein